MNQTLNDNSINDIIFEKEFIKLPIHYMPFPDWQGCNFINTIFDSLNIISKNIDRLNSEYSSIWSLARYFWIFAIHEMIDDIDKYNINEKDKVKIIEICSKLTLNNKSFAYVINNHINEFYENKYIIDRLRRYEMNRSFIKICYSHFSNSLKLSVFNCFEKYYPQIVLENYKTAKRYYKYHPDDFISLFKISQFSIISDRFFVGWLIQNHSKIFKNAIEGIKNVAIEYCKKGINYLQNIKIDENDNKIYEHLLVSEMCETLSYVYNLKYYVYFNEINEKLNVVFNSYIVTNGLKIELSFKDFNEFVISFEENNKQLKFLNLTHQLKEKEYVNNIDALRNLKTDGPKFLNLLNRIWQKQSEKFPYDKQDSLNILFQSLIQILQHCLLNKKLENELFEFLLIVSSYVDLKWFKDKLHISFEIIGNYELLSNLKDLLLNKKVNKDPIVQTLIVSFSRNLIGLIEKILRNLYLLKSDSDSNFSSEITLNQIFINDKLDMLSKGTKEAIIYFLTKDQDVNNKVDRPGCDWRNKLMHNNNDIYESFSYDQLFVIFLLYIYLIDDLFLSKI